MARSVPLRGSRRESPVAQFLGVRQHERLDMPPTYHKSDVEVLVGDHIQLKVWVEFWRGWISGRVYYVPGRSLKNSELEHGGLTWVGVHYDGRKQAGIIVMHETQQLRHTVRFVRRADDGFVETPKDYYFGD